MIEMILRLDDASNCGARGKAWVALAIVDGRARSARSHNGASYALARVLVAAGISDQPVRVWRAGIAGYMTWPSLHKMALRTIRETATFPIGEVKWSEYRGVTPPDMVNENLAISQPQEIDCYGARPAVTRNAYP